MAIFMRDFGLMIKPMVSVSTNTLMELNMRENGKMIFNMERELRLGQMAQDTKVTMHSVENTG